MWKTESNYMYEDFCKQVHCVYQLSLITEYSSTDSYLSEDRCIIKYYILNAIAIVCPFRFVLYIYITHCITILYKYIYCL